MVDSQIQEVFEQYVTRFQDLGNGNFGIREGFLDKNLEVLAKNSYDGDLWYRSPTFADHFNCSSATFHMAKDLQERGFQVKRKFTTSPEGYTQNYLEVLDPESDKWIQLDATPWYQRIGTAHKEVGEHSQTEDIEPNSSFTTHKAGQFLSTERQNDGSFIDAYFAGGYFGQTQNIEQLQKLIAAEISGKRPSLVNNPHYRFTLWARQGGTCDSETTSRADITYEVLDSARLATIGIGMNPQRVLNNPREVLEELVEQGICRVHIEGFADYHFNMAQRILGLEPTSGQHSFDYLDTIKTRGDTTSATVEWLNHHLAVLANVVVHLGPTLRTLQGETLQMSQPCAKVDIFGSRRMNPFVAKGVGDALPKFDFSKYLDLKIM